MKNKRVALGHCPACTQNVYTATFEVNTPNGAVYYHERCYVATLLGLTR